MKPRDFLNFFKTGSGKLITFAAVFAVALILFSVMRKRHTAPEDTIPVTPLATNSVGGKPQVVQSVVRPMQAFHPPSPKPQPAPSSPSGLSGFTNASPQPLPVVPPSQLQQLSPISLFADSTAGVPQPKKLSPIYAPFGRLIPCETVVTVDSASIRTPIIGLVTEDVYSSGYRGSRHGADRPPARADRQQQQLDVCLAKRRGDATQGHRVGP